MEIHSETGLQLHLNMFERTLSIRACLNVFEDDFLKWLMTFMAGVFSVCVLE